MIQTSPFRTSDQRKADREQKRDAVLRAAVRLFNERGFHAASLEDVAASLGISKPTIYHYLGNKDQVLLECVTRGVDQLREAGELTSQSPGTGLDRLRDYLRRYAEVIMDDFGRCLIRTPDEALSQESSLRLRALKREIDVAMRAMLNAGIADGSIAPIDVKFTAFTLAGALNWPARWHRADGTSSPAQVAAQIVDILTNGLAPR